MSSGFARHFLNFSGNRTCFVEFPLAIAARSPEPATRSSKRHARSLTTLNEKHELSSRHSPLCHPESL